MNDVMIAGTRDRRRSIFCGVLINVVLQSKCPRQRVDSTILQKKSKLYVYLFSSLIQIILT